MYSFIPNNLALCLRICDGSGIMGKDNVSVKISGFQFNRAWFWDSRCQITNTFSDSSNRKTIFLVWSLDSRGANIHLVVGCLPTCWLLAHPRDSCQPLTGSRHKSRDRKCGGHGWRRGCIRHLPGKPRVPERETPGADLAQELAWGKHAGQPQSTGRGWTWLS